MSNLRHYLYLMLICIAIVGVVCALLFASLKAAFMANWGFNLMILCAFAVGTGINIYQVLRLEPEINWMNVFRTGRAGRSVAEESPILLKPLIKHLSDIGQDRFRLSALSLRTVLEGIRAHLDESREISHYMIGLLVFLGLLGTFWGLLGTISSVGKAIGGLQVGTGDFALVFETLKEGLQDPLSGMGTAFSSSLFGLGGSLVLGFIDIQASHAQNRFFNEMEEWLSGVTQLVDKGEESEMSPIRRTGSTGNIQNNLEVLIKEIRKNQQSVERLIELQKKMMEKDKE
ncbi:MAG: biopolymer transporter ExbB [Deltaproteobacteria bacterium]|nr:biopolymer transporter ExbB [Deltaproteobacteria bacterium]